MGDIKTTYESADLGHHVRQGLAWLENSEGGRNTAALSYAAFDLRLGVERLAMQYWLDALGRNVVDNDVRTIWKFDRIEKAIYDLVGHQLEIDRTFEFMRVAMAALKIDAEMVTPRIGDLRTAWDNCSELCHIGGVLGLSDPAVYALAHATLTAIAEPLLRLVDSPIRWPRIENEGFDAACSLRGR